MLARTQLRTKRSFEARLAEQEKRVSAVRRRLAPSDGHAAWQRVRELAPGSPAAHEAHALNAFGFEFRGRRVFHGRGLDCDRDPPSPPPEVCEEIAQAAWRAVFFIERAVRGALGLAPPPKGPPPLPLPPDWTPALRPGEREPLFKFKDSEFKRVSQ